jgi:hypothetical protein
VDKTTSFTYNYVAVPIIFLYGYNRNGPLGEEPLKKYLDPDDYFSCEKNSFDSTNNNCGLNSNGKTCYVVEKRCYDTCEVCCLLFFNMNEISLIIYIGR